MDRNEKTDEATALAGLASGGTHNLLSPSLFYSFRLPNWPLLA